MNETLLPSLTVEDFNNKNIAILEQFINEAVTTVSSSLSSLTNVNMETKKQRFQRILIRVTLGVLLTLSAITIDAEEKSEQREFITLAGIRGIPPIKEPLLPTDGIKEIPVTTAITPPIVAPPVITTAIPAMIGRNLRLNLEFDDQVTAQQAIVTLYHSIDGSPYKEFLKTKPGVMMIPIRIEEVGKKHCFYGVVSLGPDSSSASEPFCEIIRAVPKIKKLTLTSE